MTQRFDNPLSRFATLLAQATEAGMSEPTAMSLATVGPDNRPSSRMVLLKGADARGFVFFTNLESRKAIDLAGNPFAALCFFWDALGIQVRVEGEVEPVTDDEADLYFASRPRGSQIGAWASSQSRPLVDRADLEARIREYEDRFDGRQVSRPPFWSGFRLRPDRIEFWYGREDRLHEREVFTRGADGADDWQVERLYP